MPRNPALNRGFWRKLENQIRREHATYVQTGAIYANCGNDKIEAPCYIFKIAHLPDGGIPVHFAKNAHPRQ